MADNYINDGKILTFLESAITHPTHSSGFVESGDPVVIGDFAGVALSSAAAATDEIAVALEGVYEVSVTGTNGSNVAVAIGDLLYISTAALVSKTTSGKVFGIAHGAVQSGATTAINVKLSR